MGAAPGQIDGPHQGLAQFGVDRGAAGSVAGGHGANPPQPLQAAALAEFGQPAVAHQLAAQGRALAHREPAVVLFEVLGGGQAQHRITEEFQPFMVARQAGGGVAEGLFQRR
jgi:hypothetical protein